MSEYDGRIAKSDEQVAMLLSERPNGWEYLLYAGAMCAGVERLETKYSDYSISYAPRLGIMIHSEELLHFAQSQLGELQVMVGTLNRILDPQVMEDVLGPLGVSGEPDRVLHGASRLVRIYEDMLLWAERIRGMAMPSEYREAVELLAQMAGQPIGELRDFVHRFGDQIDNLPGRLARGERVEIAETITFTLSGDLIERFNAKLEAAVLNS
jgi:hypothetical protein